jgi:glutaredoxin
MSGRVWLLLIGLALALLMLREHKAVAANDPRLYTGESGVVMLTAEWCGYCRRQEAMFERAGVRFEALDIDTEIGEQAYRALRGRGVPLTVVGQHVIRGYNVDALRSKLAPLGYTLR